MALEQKHLVAIVVGVIAAIGGIIGAVITVRGNDKTEAAQLVKVRCDPTTAAPGATVTLRFDVKVEGDEGLRLGLGATMFVGDQEISDDSGGRVVTVIPGDSTGDSALTRTFVVPASVPAGEYELAGELWRGEIGAAGQEALDDDSCSLTVTAP